MKEAWIKTACRQEMDGWEENEPDEHGCRKKQWFVNALGS
jgi:hypothetical protein